MTKTQLSSSFHTLEFIYVQSTGALLLGDAENGFVHVARGYSGKGSAINDPRGERLIAAGPIPRGKWAIRPALRHGKLGEVAIPLAPVAHEAFGRSGFYVHGDNRSSNGTASSGCIILARPVRELIEFMRKNGCSTLEVVDSSPLELRLPM